MQSHLSNLQLQLSVEVEVRLSWGCNNNIKLVRVGVVVQFSCQTLVWLNWLT